jgi:hypothetical protein
MPNANKKDYLVNRLGASSCNLPSVVHKAENMESPVTTGKSKSNCLGEAGLANAETFKSGFSVSGIQSAPCTLNGTNRYGLTISLFWAQPYFDTKGPTRRVASSSQPPKLGTPHQGFTVDALH